MFKHLVSCLNGKPKTVALLHPKYNSILSNAKHWQVRLKHFTVKQDEDSHKQARKQRRTGTHEKQRDERA
jgi:hypothetical protein